MKHVHDIVYREVVGFRPLALDFHAPTDPAATIVYLHGGGWRRGSRRDTVVPGFHGRLAAAGFAVAAADYRLSGEATFPAQLDDVRAAIEWVHANGPTPVFLWGESAGAHLALLAALDGSTVDAVVAWYPPTDLVGLPADRAAVGGGADNSRETELLGPASASSASPLTYVRRDAPPILLMHGDADDVVPAAQSSRLAEALRAAGAPVALDIVAGAGHMWRDATDFDAIMTRSITFLRSSAPGS